MSYSVTTTYEAVSHTVRRSGKCPTCGGNVVRQRTFTQTISPFNKIDDKSRPKTYAEVLESVKADAAAWTPAPDVFEHESCRTAPHQEDTP